MATSPPDAFFAIEAMTEGDKFRVGVEFKFYSAARAPGRVLFSHASFPFNYSASRRYQPPGTYEYPIEISARFKKGQTGCARAAERAVEVLP
jgi:hypothetical protein